MTVGQELGKPPLAVLGGWEWLVETRGRASTLVEERRTLKEQGALLVEDNITLGQCLPIWTIWDNKLLVSANLLFTLPNDAHYITREACLVKVHLQILSNPGSHPFVTVGTGPRSSGATASGCYLTMLFLFSS